MNDTIMNMISNLKPKRDEMNFEFTTPIKRSPSSDSSHSEDSSIKSNAQSERGGPSPAKKFKSDPKFNLNYIGSPREMRRLRADLLESRNTILSLENRISQLHTLRKDMELNFDNESKLLKRQHEYDRKTIEELENQLQNIRQRESDLKNELIVFKNKFEKGKLESDSRIEELEKTVSDVKSESRFQEVQENDEISHLKRDLLKVQNQLDSTDDEAAVNKKLSDILQRSLSERKQIEKELDLKDQALRKAKEQLKELEYDRNLYEEFKEQTKTQVNKLMRFPEMEKELQECREANERLKNEVRNKLLLEEEVHSLKSRLSNFKEKEEKFATLQVQHAQAEMYLDEWRTIARAICDSSSSSPRVLRMNVERLQQQEITLTSEKVELESRLNSAVHEAEVAKAENEKNHKLLNDLKKTADQKQSLIHRLQKKLLLISRERDSYRAQLDSYEKDLTISVNTTITGSASNPQQNQKERIESLEKIVDGYRDMVSKLETDLQNTQPGLMSDLVPIRADQITRLQKEIDALKGENQRLRERSDNLEIQIEKYSVGQDSVFEGKILHADNNPVYQCITQRENHIENLEKEVQRLKKKLKNMEEGLESSKINDTLVSTKEVQQLKEEIQSYESKYQRLKEYTKNSMQDFRSVVYMLLGYKIDRTSTSIYKLTSMYAEHEDDQLCFQVNPDGNGMSYLENNFSSTIESLIDLHLRHQQSVPMFLSGVTMDLFSNKTTTKTFTL